MLQNIPQVTKNLLILNVLMFILTLFFEQQGTDLRYILGGHYVNAESFRPYQLVTHFFMHGGIAHIFMNMFVLFMFGGFLERLWGPKRYFIFYVATAIGAFALYNVVGVYQLAQIKSHIAPEILTNLEQIVRYGNSQMEIAEELNGFFHSHGLVITPELQKYYDLSTTPMIGASGAIFGLTAAFAILFPNTELQLLFPPIPIKAKFLVGGYFLLEVYLSFSGGGGDHVAHLAHVGGAIVGAIIVLIWRRRSNNFY